MDLSGDCADLTRACGLPGLDAAHYRPHALHGEAATWQEKNCYVDLWIELVHALGNDPLALMLPALTVDFEGDQWTFFKPSHDEMRRFYGIDVQEMILWRPLLDHAVEHLSAGKLICIETDAIWLPDTAGTDYRRNHVKTSVVLADVDVAAQRLGYFHGPGYFQLEGDDFAQLFQLANPVDAKRLPLFAELVRRERLRRPTPDALRALAAAGLPDLVARCPASNPVHRFAMRVERELPTLRAQGLDAYHAWAFATLRQLGSSFELAGQALHWLQGSPAINSAVSPAVSPADAPADAAPLARAARAFDAVSSHSKTLILKLARAVASGRAVDVQALFEPIVAAWDDGMRALQVHAAQ